MRTKASWTEKYRPRKLTEISSQDNIVSLLRSGLEGDIPHLLFYGPPGTGKTSAIFALARQLFGEDRDKRVTELNASDERGVDIVRGKIVTKAKESLRGNCSVAFKLIILDEADAMAKDAQIALRKVIEDYSKSTRFCFICNYVGRVTKPIASRCVKLRFCKIPEKEIIRKLSFIAINEGVSNRLVKLIPRIANVSNGDLRKAVTLLQVMTEDTSLSIKELANVPSRRFCNKLFKMTISNCNLVTVTSLVIRESFSLSSIILDFCKRFNNYAIDNQAKAKILIRLCHSERRLLEGTNEFCEVLGLISYIRDVISNKPVINIEVL